MKLESTVNQKTNTSVPTFCLLKHKSSELIVLRTAEKELGAFQGVVVHSDLVFPVGHFLSHLYMIHYEPFAGEVTLKQD